MDQREGVRWGTGRPWCKRYYLRPHITFLSRAPGMHSRRRRRVGTRQAAAVSSATQLCE